MIVYKVFRKDYELRRSELIGILVERRKDLRGKTPLESGIRWAKLVFDPFVKDKKEIFIIPKEVKIGEEKRLLLEKGVITKDFLNIIRMMD